ncbi:MAG: DNA repair protein RecO [Nitrospirota bacterium]
MQSVKTRAIVIHSLPFGESDLIVTFFSPDAGIIKGIAKGARKSRRRFQGSLEPFATVALGAFVKESGALARVDAADLLDARLWIREDLKKFGVGCVMLELVSVFEVPGAHSREAFSLLETALNLLEKSRAPSSLLAAFFVKYLKLSGFGLPFSSCGKCGADLALTGATYAGGFSIYCPRCVPKAEAALGRGTVAFIRRAESVEDAALGRLKLGPYEEREALDFLGKFTAASAGKRLKTLDIINEF